MGETQFLKAWMHLLMKKWRLADKLLLGGQDVAANLAVFFGNRI
jgi:hypothetical protein